MPKQTQAEANYRRGTPVKHCGICRYYQGHQRCSQVMGKISPYGVSDIYAHENNAFGKTLAPHEHRAIHNIARNAHHRAANYGR